MLLKVHRSEDHTRAIIVRSSRVAPSKRILSSSRTLSRSESQLGTKSYDDACQRAFQRAKQQVFFNPDLQLFVTLTYKSNMLDENRAMIDFKRFIRKQRKMSGCELKFVYVFERQKRGAIHIHGIFSRGFLVSINNNGYQQLKYWSHGFTSVLPIEKTDSGFKAYLYLFKYMRKSQRIGRSFVHTSRNLNSFKEVPYEQFDEYLYELQLKESTRYLGGSYPETTDRYYLQSYRPYQAVWDLMATSSDPLTQKRGSLEVDSQSLLF